MTQRLSIKHLQVLAAFRRTGSLTKIAELLKLTPSAVSRRIDEAEARLGRAENIVVTLPMSPDERYRSNLMASVSPAPATVAGANQRR